MKYKKTLLVILIIVFCASLIANGYLGFLLAKTTKLYNERQTNLKILAFRNMFTEKVLLADKEIDFDTRLSLETSVRTLNDQEIFDQWQTFTQTLTKEDASLQAKKLLRLLVEKTTIE